MDNNIFHFYGSRFGTDKTPTETIPVNGIFLHGKAEEKVGYDVVTLNKDEYKKLSELKDAVVDNVSVVNCNTGEIYGDCVLYKWLTGKPDFDTKLFRGMIVFKNDPVGVAEAEEKYNDKSFFV